MLRRDGTRDNFFSMTSSVTRKASSVIFKTVTNICLASLLAPALAQSGNPDWAPMPNPDLHLAALRTGGGRLRAPGQIAISPDSTLLAWTLGGRGGGSLNLTDLKDSSAKDKVVTIPGTSDCSNGAPVWSPDSKTLAFTSTCTGDKSGQPQVFLYSHATGEAKQLTHLKGIFQQVAWSPDGKSLGFLFVENAREEI